MLHSTRDREERDLGHARRRGAFTRAEVEMSFFVAGGFPMVFVVVFGLVALSAAIAHARNPSTSRLAAAGLYGLAVALTSVAGTAVDLSVVFARYPDFPAEQATTYALVGVSEALSPVILGFSILSIVALVSGLGSRRLP
jgi:hypothetical protein